MQTYWFLALMSSICLEGLGRRYLPGIPAIAFYLLKDVILLLGALMFPPSDSLKRLGSTLYRGFAVFWLGGLLWTIIECANPQQQSFVLALIGLRAYWLWWLAPVVIAGVLQSTYHRRRAILVLSFTAIVVSGLAAMQFVSPPDANINVYSVVDGEALHASDAGTVYSTGRARVASTFAFISGFVDFTILVPALLLSLGLETSDKRTRTAALASTMCLAAVLPMSGSRSSVVLGLGVLAVTCYAAGLFFTAVGRRVIVGGIVGIVLATLAFPDALFGVQSRFDTDETTTRFLDTAAVLPPVALATFDYPFGGTGTGMMQNAAASMHIYTQYAAEAEMNRYLVELGVIGFLLIWMVKCGLMVALLRAYKILRRDNRRAASGTALSYAAVTFFGNITFDHIWQALFFVGAGFILAETQAALTSLKAKAEAAAPRPAIGPPPLALGR